MRIEIGVDGKSHTKYYQTLRSLAIHDLFKNYNKKNHSLDRDSTTNLCSNKLKQNLFFFLDAKCSRRKTTSTTDWDCPDGSSPFVCSFAGRYAWRFPSKASKRPEKSFTSWPYFHTWFYCRSLCAQLPSKDLQREYCTLYGLIGRD